MRIRMMAAMLATLPLLSACASTGGRIVPEAQGASGSRPVVRQPVRPVARDPQFRMEPGLEGVIGATQGQLVNQFGPPRLNVWEGDARKLQYSGSACILDIYLYPTSRAPEPLATYIDARRASDGKDVSKAACVRALRGR